MKNILPLTLSLSLLSPLGALVSSAADVVPAKPAAPATPAVPATPAAPGLPPPAQANPALAQRREEMMKKYDKNGDGKLDQEELAAMRKDRESDLLKKYDKNGNGKLDDDEREVYRADMKKQREELLNKRNADREKVQPKEEKKDEKK